MSASTSRGTHTEEAAQGIQPTRTKHKNPQREHNNNNNNNCLF